MEKKTLYRYFGNCATEEERIQVLEWTKASPENLKEFCRERNIYNAILLSTDNIPVYIAIRPNHETQNIVCIFFISKTKAFCLNTFSDEKHIHPACFVGIRYDTE